MDIFDEYERRFAEAKLGKKHRKPWVESDRQAIIEDAKALLRWKDELVPEIRVISERKQICDGYFMTDIVYESWKGFYGCADLFTMPFARLYFIVPGIPSTDEWRIRLRRPA